MKTRHLTTALLVVLLAAAPLQRMAAQTVENSGTAEPLAQRPKEPTQAAREKWEALPLEEKQRILENYREWKQLPPHARMRLRENLERLNKMPPAAKERLFQNLKRFEAMPREQQERLLKNFELWKKLGPAQRRELREKWQQMSPERREEFFRRFLNEHRPQGDGPRPPWPPRQLPDERLQQLPPEQRERLLEKLRTTPPDQRDELIRRFFEEQRRDKQEQPQEAK